MRYKVYGIVCVSLLYVITCFGCNKQVKTDESIERSLGVVVADMEHTTTPVEKQISIFEQIPAFAVSNRKEFETADKTYGYEIITEQGDSFLSKVPFAGEWASFSYHFDDEDNVTFCEAIIVFKQVDEAAQTANSTSFSGKELREKSLDFLNAFCNLFYIPFEGPFNIYSNDGQSLSIAEDDTYEMFAKGEAYLSFTLKDKDSAVWFVFIDVNDNGVPVASIERRTGEDYAFFEADVTIEKG